MTIDNQTRKTIMADFCRVSDAMLASDAQLPPSRVFYDLVNAFDEASNSTLRHSINFGNSAQITAMILVEELKARGTLDDFCAFVGDYVAKKGLDCPLGYKPIPPK